MTRSDDTYSHTLEDAAEWHARHHDEQHAHTPDYDPDDDGPVEDDDCGCTDPACPCGGRKVGVP